MQDVRGGPLVLIVDDDPLIARGFQLALRLCEVEPRVAASAVELELVLAEKHWREFDGALIDVSLPDASGLEIAAADRLANKRIDVAIVSAVVTDAQIRADLTELNLPFFPKPFDFEQIRSWASGVKNRSKAAKVERCLAALAQRCGLSPKEIEVLRELWQRPDVQKVIAARLGISAETMKSHVKSILRKTGASTLRELLKTLDELV